MPVDPVLYVLGTESSGKTDLLHRVECLSTGATSPLPKRRPATTGQSISKMNVVSAAGRPCGEVEVRELGGAMLPAWESFLRSHAEREAGDVTKRFGLMFVVDAAAPHQLTPARYAFQTLTLGPSAVCREWPILVVVQKCAAPSAVTCAEVERILGSGIHGNAHVLEVDSWNGLGVGDVLDWLRNFSSRA